MDKLHQNLYYLLFCSLQRKFGDSKTIWRTDGTNQNIMLNTDMALVYNNSIFNVLFGRNLILIKVLFGVTHPNH